MPRPLVTPAAAVLLAAVLAQAPLGAAQEASLEVRFHAPAQAGPSVSVLEATWVLLLLGPEGSGAFTFSFPQPSKDHNVTVTRLAPPDSEDLEVPSGSGVRDLLGFSAEARFPDGVASLYLQGDRIRIATTAARADLLPRDAGRCLEPLVPLAARLSAEARYEQLCPPDGGVAVVLGAEAAAMPVHVEAEGLRVVEYHHAAMSCRGAPDCPGDAVREEREVGAGGLAASSRTLGFHRLESSGAKVAGAGRTHLVLAGGSMVDVAVQGWVRLPLASATAACAGCESPEGQTLQADGNLTLANLRGLPDGTMAADLGGDVHRARIDERGVDPGLLRGIGVAGVAVAGAAATAWFVRLVGAFFSRIPQARSLDHPRRRLMMDAIRENPGIHLRALARLAGGSPTLAHYHVDVLVRHGHVIARRQGRRICLFENHGRYGEEWKTLAALREGPLRQLHGLVDARPGMSRLEVVGAALESWGWSRRTAYHRLRRLERMGLVQSGATGLKAYRLPLRPVVSGLGKEPPVDGSATSPLRVA